MAEVRKKHPNFLPQVPNTDATQPDALVIDTDTLKLTVAKMVREAGHYKNWEKELGVEGGVALVLGDKWAETSWTKLLGKSGNRFKEVADRLREVKLPEQAEKYAALEEKLVQHQVEALLAEVHDN